MSMPNLTQAGGRPSPKDRLGGGEWPASTPGLLPQLRKSKLPGQSGGASGRFFLTSDEEQPQVLAFKSLEVRHHEGIDNSTSAHRL